MSTRADVVVASPVVVAGLAFPLALLYAPVFRDLVRVWAGSSYSSHGFLILLWSGWLAWTARGAVRTAPHRPEPGALTIVAVGLGLVVTAISRSSLALAVLSLPVSLAGLGLFALGREAFRPLAFPTAFLALMTPISPEVIPTLSLPLQQIAAWFSEQVLAAAGIAAVRDGLFIRLDSVIVHVAEGCSGLRFLLVMIVLGVGAAWAVQGPPAVRLGMVPLAVVAAIGANLVRVAGTVVLVHLYGPGAATGRLHGLFGKGLYLVALILFLVAARRIQRVTTSRRPGQILGGHDDPRAGALPAA